jgi:mono/diheme cytochrome c family protein
MKRSTRPTRPTAFNTLPKAFFYIAIFVVSLALIPPVVIARMRTVPSSRPPVHLIQNMDNQPKFRAQQENILFVDDRAMRPRLAGTIARGDMTTDTHFAMGMVGDQWATSFPDGVTVDATLLDRGQNRFNIYCKLCHGKQGLGDGIIHQRGMHLLSIGADGTQWVPAKNLHEEAIVDQAVGRIFNTITNGVRNMSGYASQISTADRWAITAYVKALQFSQQGDPGWVEGAESAPVLEEPPGGFFEEEGNDEGDEDKDTS